MSALVDLYNSAGGTNWHWDKDYKNHGYPWNITDWQNQNPCDPTIPWQGISCNAINNTTSTIIKLNLALHNLEGALPSSIANLTALTKLALNLNQLTGSIPSSIGSLTQLEHLNLGLNQFNNSLSTTIWFLTQIKLFDVGNSLTGSIPIGLMTKAIVFIAADNYLTGIIVIFVPQQ